MRSFNWIFLTSIIYVVSFIKWLIVCLGFSSHLRILHSCGDVTIAGERLQILTYAQHSWPLSSEGSLACLTYCDTGHLFIMVTNEEPGKSKHSPSVWQWSCNYLFLRLGSVAAEIRTPNLLHARRPLTAKSFVEWRKYVDVYTLSYLISKWMQIFIFLLKFV